MSPFGFRCVPFTNFLRIGFVLVAALASQGRGCGALGQQLAAKPSARDGFPRNTALLDRAKKLVQDGDAQGALSLLQTANIQGPDASDIHALKGVCLALLAQPIESAAEFDEAIALRPNDAALYFSSGLSFASLNNLDGALDRLAIALKLDPSLPGVRYNYALVLARAGKFDESERQTELEIASPHAKTESELDLWRLKARDFYSQKKWQDTIDAYRKTLELDPDSSEAYGAMGEALYSLNRTQESKAALEKAESLDPENGATHALLGKLYQDEGKQDQAIAEFEAAFRLRPGDQEVIYRLFRIYSHNGDAANKARLLAALQNLLASQNTESRNEAKATVLNDNGVELEQKGDMSGALDDFDQAASIDVTNLIFQRNAALTLCKMGRPEEAIRRLRDILSIDPDDAETLQILAVANEYTSKGSAQATLPAATTAH